MRSNRPSRGASRTGNSAGNEHKARYADLCASGASVSLFSQPWWLDVVVGDRCWDVAVVMGADGSIRAAMPYVVRKTWGGVLVSDQPALTQTLGPWLAPTSRKLARRLSDEKDLMWALIDQLPEFGHFSQNWSPEIGNWLPFFWRGFRQTTRYTYCLAGLTDEQRLWEGLEQNIRTDIRKASSRFGVSVEEGQSIEEFLALNEKVFARQGKRLPYSPDLVRRLDDACSRRGVRKILFGRDRAGRPHAAAYIVWWSDRAYYLMGGSDPEFRNSGAGSLCLWEAIRASAHVASVFDFEGSMLEPVERFFRAFGATQNPYFQVSRTTSPLLKLRGLARDLLR